MVSTSDRHSLCPSHFFVSSVLGFLLLGAAADVKGFNTEGTEKNEDTETSCSIYSLWRGRNFLSRSGLSKKGIRRMSWSVAECTRIRSHFPSDVWIEL
jgi:hypothetical protein